MPLRRARAFLTRFLLLFGFWLLLLEPESTSLATIGADLAVGAMSAVAAAVLSMRLLSPGPVPRPWPLLRLSLRFLTQSLLAGIDVSRRALDPRLPLDPALIRLRTALRPGMSRALFGALTSQVPGTLAVDADRPGELLYHCLDQGQDAASGLAVDEALFLQALGGRGVGRREPRT